MGKFFSCCVLPNGAATVDAGLSILCSYQQNYDAQLRRDRRAAD